MKMSRTATDHSFDYIKSALEDFHIGDSTITLQAVKRNARGLIVEYVRESRVHRFGSWRDEREERVAFLRFEEADAHLDWTMIV